VILDGDSTSSIRDEPLEIELRLTQNRVAILQRKFKLSLRQILVRPVIRPISEHESISIQFVMRWSTFTSATLNMSRNQQRSPALQAELTEFCGRHCNFSIGKHP
jgi:hypothetical protein